ncbi:toxin TcdB middle/C-terminal domain-containing protein, partial [Pseudomonas viridiflava]|uniref:toxin TcdB middle/C-terminal domain-containing protein n=1 Tax=Pseudomonas viridiflava TaxID=33069 RepID=UPI0013CF1A1F
FGLVLATDTETPPPQQEGFTAPVLTKTWFHTGRYPERPCDDYRQNDPQAVPLGQDLSSCFDTQSQTDTLITDASEADLREMARALSGSTLRTEVYGLTDDHQPGVLYSVSAQ